MSSKQWGTEDTIETQPYEFNDRVITDVSVLISFSGKLGISIKGQKWVLPDISYKTRCY